MNAIADCGFRIADWAACVVLISLLLCCGTAHAECKLTETKRKVEGAERVVYTLENERILVEVVPELAGRVSRYVDKTKEKSAFEWLDDCPYHYACRWEGKPFTGQADARGPNRAAVTVKGGGKIAVGHLRNVLGVDLANPLDLTVERTVSIEGASSRLVVDVKITNTGEGVAPAFRYMVHAVFGQVPHMPNAGMYWFLPTANGIEFFDGNRGRREMGAAAGGAPLDHPFSRFIPGRKADKPRYEAGGWAAVLTSAGPTYLFYEPAQYDFYQYWYGGDAEWHYTFEPHSKAVDLKPGDTVTCRFTVAYDAKDVPFKGSTVAFEAPSVPPEMTPGGALTLKARATTVKDQPEAVKLVFEVKDPQGAVLLNQEVAGEAKPFAFAELAAECKLPETAALGKYTWSAKHADGKALASGVIELLTSEQLGKRRTERATAELKAEMEKRLKEANEKLEQARRDERLWREGASFAFSLGDRGVWPETGVPAGAVSVSYRSNAAPVLGDWRPHAPLRIQTLSAVPPPAWPADAEKLLAPLAASRACVRDLAPEPDGKGLVALVVEAAKKRVEIVRLGPGGVVKRWGRCADKPAETDDTLGIGARALAVDGEGNIWAATNAWGQTSVFKLNQDNSPYEESVVGEKGAVKKFAPDGRLLGAFGTLDAPTDLVVALANDKPVLLAPYRNVSAYHGAMVREGVLVVDVAQARRAGEIKIPAASLALDGQGRLWSGDVAGHVACYSHKGQKLLDVTSSPPPAVKDARLPAGSPVPAAVRATGADSIAVLYTLQRKLAVLDATGQPKGGAIAIPEATGAAIRLLARAPKSAVLGEKTIWCPE
jgi:hypothetical protein